MVASPSRANRELHGVFEATAPGGLNLEPDAWTNNSNLPHRKADGQFSMRGASQGMSMSNNRGGGGGGSPFPAQVRFEVTHAFPALHESKFHHVMRYKQGQAYGWKGANKFDDNLTAMQVGELMSIFMAEQATANFNGGRSRS